jgi:putative serine protease PepD
MDGNQGIGTVDRGHGSHRADPHSWWTQPRDASNAVPVRPTWPAGAFPPAPPTGHVIVGRPVPPPRRRRMALGLVALSLAAGVGGGTAGVLLSGNGGTTATVATTATGAADSTTVTAATSGTVAAAAAKIGPSVVTILVNGAGSSDIGTGVILRSDGYILTNNHVISDGGTITVKLTNGTSYTATVVGQSQANDLAVVKIHATGLTPATFANSSAVSVGDLAVAVGSPLGLSNTVTSGVVSALNRTIDTSSTSSIMGDTSGGATIRGAIQTDAPINPGNSGGALVNARGQVIGITSAIASTGSSDGGESGSIGVGFAIPSNTAVRIAAQLVANGTTTGS